MALMSEKVNGKLSEHVVRQLAVKEMTTACSGLSASQALLVVSSHTRDSAARVLWAARQKRGCSPHRKSVRLSSSFPGAETGNKLKLKLKLKSTLNGNASSLRLQRRSSRSSKSQFERSWTPARSSYDNGFALDDRYSEDDDDYVDSTVVEAVEVESGIRGFFMKMCDGRYVKCFHNSPDGGRLPEYPSQPAIVLKLNDGSGLMLPILVLELPQTLLMETLHNKPVIRPDVYHFILLLFEQMQWEVKFVRVTHRVMEAYHARIYVQERSGAREMRSFDMRPSDAVNLAARCKVPIQVNKHLAASDGIRVVGDLHCGDRRMVDYDMDRPEGMDSFEMEEFLSILSLNDAVAEERYNDAALLRDQLKQLRSKQMKREE